MPVPDMKMLYFIMIVLFQVNQVLVVKIEDLPKDHEYFIAVINKLHKDIDPENSDNIISGYGFKDGMFEPQVFVTFKRNLLLIIEQMAYYYFDKKDVILFNSEYIFNVCPLLPRLLDFIYVGSVINSNIILLNKMYIVLCKKLPSFYKNYNYEYISYVNEKHLREQIDAIFSSKQLLVKNEPVLQEFLFNKDTKREFNNIKYLSTIYMIIGSINMIPIMRNNPGKKWYDIFDNHSLYDKMITKTSKSLEDIDKNIQQFTDNSFQKINENYIEVIIQNKCGELNNKLKDREFSKPTVIHELLLYTLERLNNYYMYFLSESLETLKKNTTEDQNIKNNLLEMLKVTCIRIPLILMYLIEFNVNDTKLLSLYLTFCSDFKGFTSVRCSSLFHAKVNDENNVACKLESTRNFFTWNIFTITNKVPEIDKYVQNELCIQLNLYFINNIHDIVFKYYGEKSVPVWTTFEWLSGTYFLTSDYTNVQMNEIKSKNIIIKDETMSLSVAYYALLPWMLNAKSLMGFHDMIVLHLNTTIDQYVYRHAQIINMYLQQQLDNSGCNVENKVLEFIRTSLRWYEHGTKIFYEYLYFPFVQGRPQTSLHIDKLISAIVNINNENCRNIETFIPDSARDDITQFFFNNKNSKNFNESNKFDLTIEWNCNYAMDFVSTFILIVNKSMRMKIEFDKEKMKELYCLSHSIFVVKSRGKSINIGK
ncbi:Hypothetical protein CINCED_3A020654 [Cinara cedri]|nr:Hypothetical protein CINCED_3A020654 [Cinara cedri]